MSSDRSDQPVYQTTQPPPVEATIPENGSEVTESYSSNSAIIINSNDKKLEDARRAVTRLSVAHPEWLNRSKALASLLSKRFEETSRDSLIAECIDIQRQICAICTPDNPGRALSLSDLALSLRMCFNQTGEAALLTEAIDLTREALSLRPIGHPDRSLSCNNLAIALCTGFWETGDRSLLAEAIDLNREALTLCPGGHPERSMLCNSQGLLLWTCFNQTGEESVLTEAIDLHREAFHLRTSGHPERCKSCNNLALALLARFQQTGEESLLSETIELQREALSLRSSGHPGRSTSCNSLATALSARFYQTGEDSLLTEVIELFREALYLQPSGHPRRSTSCSNLALALHGRFNQTGEESLLAEAIDLHREALSLRPTRHPSRSTSCNNLAFSLHAHFKQAGEESLLIEAIYLYREALSLQTSMHPEQFGVCNRMVASLRTHFEITGDESLLIEAIELCKNTMETQPQHHPSRWKAYISLSKIYLNYRFSQHNTILAIDYIQQALSLISDTWPTLLSEVTHLTGLIDMPMLSQDSLLQLLQCFSAAIDLASRVAGFVLNPESQLRHLSSSRHLGPRAYWCALACGQPQRGLELLEHARAMIWTQALHMRNPQLSGIPPELASELEVLLNKMYTYRAPEDSVSLPSHDRDVRYRNSDRIHQLIQQIRGLPGQERFMRGLSSHELAQCASRAAVVVLVATEGECHALILQPDNQKPVALKLYSIAAEELTAMKMAAAVAQKRGAAPDSVGEKYRGMKPLPCQSLLNQTRSDPLLVKLWTTVVKPVIDCLGLQKSSGSSRPRLHWCPTGPFMFLPLHAAGIYDSKNTDCCADYVVCSYTPTLTALLRAQKSNPSFHRRDAKLGLIAAMQAWDANLPSLPMVEEEISNVRAAAERESVSVDDSGSCVGDAAVVARVAEVFRSTNMTHIACHGKQNAANALSSGFSLSDADFSISRLMDLDLKDAFFAFLSACETAKGDDKQPDQTVHLAAAMLFVGFRSVVGTMWAMEDIDGPRIAKLFYERLFAEEVITLDTIPYALDYAVAELRNSGVSPSRWATFIHMGA